jgi:hypothetical protein
VSAAFKGQGARKLRVGVTLHVREGAQSIWENGIFQNCVFLVLLLKNSPAVEHAVLVKGGTGTVAHKDMMLDEAGVAMIDVEEAMQTLDVVIEMSAQLDENWVHAFRARGGRYVWMRVGNDYVIDIERAMFNRPHGSLISSKPYDAVWTIPEFERSCGDYFRLMARAPLSILPHLWTPLFFDKAIRALPEGAAWGYRPGRARWRLSMFEPNICMVKTSVIPMLVCEEAYRAKPGKVESVRVCNTLHLKDHPGFVHFARSLDIVRHGVATFEGRHPVAGLLAQHGDCVVSHHWENGQNYLYYEALYGGYPLVHNSSFIRGYGYYYEDFDCQEGGRALLHALDTHDERLADYRCDSAKLLMTLDVGAPENVEAYTRELLRLYDIRLA